MTTTEPGWINRQYARIERDSATWPEWMKREVKLKAHGQKLSISRDLLEDAAKDGDPFSAAVLQAAKPRLRWRHGADTRSSDIWTVRPACESWHPWHTMAWCGGKRYFDSDADLYEAFFA